MKSACAGDLRASSPSLSAFLSGDSLPLASVGCLCPMTDVRVLGACFPSLGVRLSLCVVTNHTHTVGMCAEAPQLGLHSQLVFTGAIGTVVLILGSRSL